ncbi:MAG: hypothetical protein JW871_01655 [Endomicrobiales bacterium]|nr:hypothetical protein [Endomicrobiales bacterium]
MILKTTLALIIGGFLGGVMGYLLRCSGGACPLTCNPWGGAIFGALLALSFVLNG